MTEHSGFSDNYDDASRRPHKSSENNLSKLQACIACSVVFFILGCLVAAPQKAGSAPQDTLAPSPETTVLQTPTQSNAQTISYEILSEEVIYWEDILGDQQIQTIIEIKNTGTCNIKIKSVSYELEDSTGKFLGVFDDLISKYPGILEPGETGIIYDESTLDVTLDGEPKIILDVEVEPTNLKLNYFPVSDFQIVEGQWGTLKMMGRVENTSEEVIEDMCIFVLLYDENGNLIGADNTYVHDIDAESKKGFDSTFYSLPDFVEHENIVSWKVFAYEW